MRVCQAVCNGSGKFGGRDYSSERDLCTYYTLYCMCVLTSGHTRGAAADVDAVWSDHVRLSMLARVTTTQACWCIRVGDCARLMQLLQLLHREELQVPDCSHRRTKGFHKKGAQSGSKYQASELLVDFVNALLPLYIKVFGHQCLLMTGVEQTEHNRNTHTMQHMCTSDHAISDHNHNNCKL